MDQEQISIRQINLTEIMRIVLQFLLVTVALLISLNLLAVSEPYIITSTMPLASITKLLVGDKIRIESLADDKHSGCAHHHSFKISDVNKINKANLAIFIDEQFDNAAAKMIMSHSSNYLKVSDFIGVKNGNWHFWLSLDLTERLITKLMPILIDKFPDMKNNMEQNLAEAVANIKFMKKYKEQKLSQIGKVIITDESLEYLFNDDQIIQFYLANNKNINMLNKLQKSIDDYKVERLIFITDQNLKYFDKINLPKIQLETEDWRGDYLDNYKNILGLIK